MMDVHRARFVPFPAHAVTAAAFSRACADDTAPAADDTAPAARRPPPTLRLALGRANGHIEIWSVLRGRWAQESVLAGDRSVDGLVWTRDPAAAADPAADSAAAQPLAGPYRLFSIASSPHVLEWDLQRRAVKRRSTGNFSAVWCFAAQPPTTASRAPDLVAGCGDGTIALLSTSDNDLQFQRFLARVAGKRAKCISITYQTRDRVVAGFADGSIRVIDARNGSVVRTMSLGVGVPPAPRHKFVWKVKCLPDGDIVSGDSNGDVVFWDGRSYSLSQRIKGHDSDCVDIVTAADGETVLTGSLDGRVAIYHKLMNPNGRKSWAKTAHRRLHAKSEVKAMAAYDADDMSIVVSGGSDLVPTIVPMRGYGKENPTRLTHLPQSMLPVASASRARLLVSWWDNSVSIWRIARPYGLEPQPPRKLVGKLVLKSKQAIRCVAISVDGRSLATATDSELKMFHLRRTTKSDIIDFKAMRLPGGLGSSGARVLCFSPDGKWLAAVDLDNDVHILRITHDRAKPRRLVVLDRAVELERHRHPANLDTAWKDYEEGITRLAFSSDARVLVAGDLSGRLDSWVLEGHEDLTAPPIDVAKHDSPRTGDEDASADSSDDSDSDDLLCIFYGQHWTENPAAHLLPKLDSCPLVLTFRPSTPSQPGEVVDGNTPGTQGNPHAHSPQLPRGPYRLWVMTTTHQMYEFDVLEGRLSDWSRRNPTSALPADFHQLTDRVLGAVWDTSGTKQRLWLHGCNWLFMLDVAHDLIAAASKKRRRPGGPAADAGDTTTTTPKRPLLRDGLPRRIARLEDGVATEVDLHDRHPPRPAPPPDHDMDDEPELALTRVPSAAHHHPPSALEPVPHGDPPRRRWWCTFQYRPILGIVLLEDPASPEPHRPVEVVIVERPVWDVLDAAHRPS